MTRRFPRSVVSALALGQLASALVPADPTITAAPELKRQNDAQFIGYVSSEGTWYTQSCNSGLTWYQDGKYAQCCPTTLASCYAPTACSNGFLIYPYSDLSSTTTIACTENFENTAFSICNTAFIFENFEDSQPQTDIVCGAKAQNWSYYRKIPATATERVSTPPSDDSTTTTSPITSTSTSPVPPPSPKSKSSSKAWIAGAVVGPIIGIALIAGVVFFLMKKKKKEDTTHGAAAATTTQPPTAQYSDAKPTFVAAQGGFNPNDQYGQQQAYPQQPMSPAPQYAAPYDPAQSPPPVGVYAPETKQGHYQAPSQPMAAELGGGGSTTAAPPAAGGNAFTAELDGQNAPPK
ncbi:hypothetical protein P154DRAFT_521249 [Amniculicola lignicola CBS 123094]|uniref:Mid2 domain-containing protein n=1 Tax=Amniculicola lignicola CBS 123094 TaxID=1392246 RepID=A0A6A5WPK7_9PLEO|nr:hypothetical protein P154DRAFT_521249 [Amniculicola lignicola CBS 123094]